VLLVPGLIGVLGLTSIGFLIDTHGYAHSDRVEEITVYTPPTLSKLINDYSELFMAKHGVRVNIVVDATGRLINKLELTRKEMY
jgi:ABC-type molybdate transport system substrate-binding protein